jgi:hypothetical protein
MNAPAWLNLDTISERHTDEPGNFGIVVSVKPGQAITALVDGDIVGAGLMTYGGVVTVRSYVPLLGYADIYYQHIQPAPGIQFCKFGACYGQTVRRGDVLGYATHDYVETGINSPYHGYSPSAGLWGPKVHPTRWVEYPDVYFKLLLTTPNRRASVPGVRGRILGALLSFAVEE